MVTYMINTLKWSLQRSKYKHIRDWCFKWWVNENMGKIFLKGKYFWHRHKRRMFTISIR